MPCPVCGKPDWCGISADGCIAVCMRIQSSRPSRNGGWTHIIQYRTRCPHPSLNTTCPGRRFDAAKYHAAIRAEWDHVWLDGTAMLLNVDRDALDRLKPGWDSFNRAVGFPMLDDKGGVIGIRLRSSTGHKWAVAGSQDGLFYDPEMTLGNDGELVVCEGPTDTAAAYTLGLCAVGRSTCKTGVGLIKSLARRFRARLVTVVCDNDGWKKMAGRRVRPGLDGAISLCREMGRQYRIVVSPAKDIRTWLAEGLTLKEFREYADVALKRIG
jgi:hypothetical protein